MVRLFSLMLWFPLSLAMVLATVAVLAVPETAFADAACEAECGMPGDDDYGSCMENCGIMDCVMACANDPVCEAGCGTAYYYSSCPGAPATACRVNDGDQGACSGGACSNPAGRGCKCTWDSIALTCNCPP